jgi:hypothetical protein
MIAVLYCNEAAAKSNLLFKMRDNTRQHSIVVLMKNDREFEALSSANFCTIMPSEMLTTRLDEFLQNANIH